MISVIVLGFRVLTTIAIFPKTSIPEANRRGFEVASRYTRLSETILRGQVQPQFGVYWNLILEMHLLNDQYLKSLALVTQKGPIICPLRRPTQHIVRAST